MALAALCMEVSGGVDHVARYALRPHLPFMVRRQWLEVAGKEVRGELRPRVIDAAGGTNRGRIGCG